MGSKIAQTRVVGIVTEKVLLYTDFYEKACEGVSCQIKSLPFLLV